jgi:peptidoglycan/LPS O-acetylase OafA/YrhL
MGNEDVDGDKGRNARIDCLRGASILCVAVVHYLNLYAGSIWPIPTAWTHIIVRGSYYGVSVFFVISGFIITMTMLKRWGALADISLSGFYVMRAARIIPSILLLLVILAFLHAVRMPFFVAPSNAALMDAMWSALTLRSDDFTAFRMTDGLRSFGQLWSLAIEEKFYLVWPLLCIGLRYRSVLAIGLLVIIVDGAFNRNGDSPYFLSRSMDQLAIGCFAALLISIYRIPSRSAPVLRYLGWASIVAAFIAFPTISEWYAATAIALSAASILIGCSISTAPARRFTVIEMFGKRSYEIYLIHISIVFMLANLLGTPKGMWTLPYLVIYLGTIFAVGEVWGLYFTDPLSSYIRSKFTAAPQRGTLHPSATH